MNIDGHTKMYCLIGSPVGHSGSPAMYNYSFDRLGINSAYLAYDVPLEKTGEAVAALKLLGCGGFNVTMPCKTEVTKYPNAELTVKKLAERVPGCKATVTDLFDTEALAEAVKNCDILVNATKVGMAPLDKETLIDKSLFRHDLVVCDTVYNPKETRMIVEAKEAGVKAAIGGIGMLLRQGVEGFRLYTGQEMPADEVMDKFFVKQST